MYLMINRKLLSQKNKIESIQIKDYQALKSVENKDILKSAKAQLESDKFNPLSLKSNINLIDSKSKRHKTVSLSDCSKSEINTDITTQESAKSDKPLKKECLPFLKQKNTDEQSFTEAFYKQVKNAKPLKDNTIVLDLSNTLFPFASKSSTSSLQKQSSQSKIKRKKTYYNETKDKKDSKKNQTKEKNCLNGDYFIDSLLCKNKIN